MKPLSQRTMEMLMAVCATLGPMPPRPRIIVGFPLVEPNQFIDVKERRLMLVGKVAWAKLQGFMENADASDPELAAARIVLGVPVEYYDWQNPDHASLAMELATDLIRSKKDGKSNG